MDRSKKRRIECALLALGIVLTLATAARAADQWQEEYDRGVAAYNKRDYSAAADLFWKSINDGNKGAGVWLYMAHSRAGEGKLEEARKFYKCIIDIFKTAPEAKVAAAYIKALDANTWHPGPPPGAVPTKPVVKAVAPQSAPGPANGFRTRITIIAPRFEHPQVSAQTIAMVKTTIDALPKSIYKILEDGGAKVNIGPNIIDKWPDSLNDVKPGQVQLTLAQEPGRTYGRDIHIYERSVVVAGSRELGEARSMKEMQANLLHEIGHAVDDCLGVYSKNSDLQAQYRMDSEAIPEDSKATMSYYLQGAEAGAAEACAESVCVLLGGQHNDTDRFTRCFPRTEAWVKAKLKL